MPPSFAQKSNAKKGGAGRDSNARRSRSRNTTPGLTQRPAEMETPLTEVRMKPFSISSYDEIVEQQSGSGIPDSKSLDTLIDRIENLLKEVESRGNASDRGMRRLAGLRKDRLEELEAERRDEEQKERLKREAAEEEEPGRKANKMKKKKETSRAREERPLAHGAHGLAPQDGSNLGTPAKSPGKGSSHKAHRNASRDPDSASSSLSPVEQTTPIATGIMDAKAGSADAEDSDSSDDHQPPPAPTIAHVQTFGDDPSTFLDPTIYEIRQINSGMSEEEIKDIYSVADYPHNDLHDLIPGTPPDKDFSNAKPSNQVQATTFATYLEPHFRPFTEEDLAFLRERGDRVSPFVIPRRGKKHYTEVWAEEDGAMVVDTPKQDRDKLPANQARGSIEDLDDSLAETDQVSAGPILSRLLATLRPEHRAPPSDDKVMTNGVSNGDYVLNGDLLNGDLHEPNPLAIDEPPPPIPPATYMPESSSESWKKATHPKLDHAQVDERIKQELRHIGFLPFDEEPDFDGHFDDEIAARLRLLQAQLKEQAIINGARKARMMDLVKERMAHQEYTTILEDLDGQVQSAYMKRTRSMGKSKKTKRPGGAGGGSHFVGAGSGMARPGIGDMTKTLMERRKKWIDNIGPVFGNEKSLGMVPRLSDEGSSIFKPEDTVEYTKREREAWDEDVEEE